MFSQTAEYALRIVVFLGTLGERPATTKQIAAATRVPEGYLAKILQSLGRARLVQSQRGLHGGSMLARDPAQITILDVVNAISPLPRILSCPLNLPSHGTRLCAVHRRLDDALAMVEKVFGESSIAELLAKNAESIPLGDLASSASAATRAAEAAFPVTPTVALNVRKRPAGRKPQ